MKNEITLQTRREFLRTTVLGSALSWTVPAFLADTFAALHSEAADSATQIVTGKDATILVVLQMAGGNDGLNTVVPYANDFYHQARPQIGLTARQGFEIERRHRLSRRDDRVQGSLRCRQSGRGAGRRLSEPEPLAFPLDGNLADRQRFGQG